MIFRETSTTFVCNFQKGHIFESMNPDSNDNELIERYLQGKLSQSEIFLFEDRVESDREFARKLRLIKTFPSLISESKEENEQKQETQNFNWDFDEKPSNISSSYRYIWVIVIIIAAGVSVYLIYSWLQRTGDTDDKITTPPIEKITKKDSIQPVEVKESVLNMPQLNESPYVLETPDDGITIDRKSEIRFSWNQVPDSITHIYIFSEPDNKVVWWRAVKPGIHEFRVPAIHLLPGKYYWYVGIKDVRRSFIISK